MLHIPVEKCSQYMLPLNFSDLRFRIWLILVNLKHHSTFHTWGIWKEWCMSHPESTPQFDFSLKKINEKC